MYVSTISSEWTFLAIYEEAQRIQKQAEKHTFPSTDGAICTGIPKQWILWVLRIDDDLIFCLRYRKWKRQFLSVDDTLPKRFTGQAHQADPLNDY